MSKEKFSPPEVFVKLLSTLPVDEEPAVFEDNWENTLGNPTEETPLPAAPPAIPPIAGEALEWITLANNPYTCG
jgi:hypothetical protein